MFVLHGKYQRSRRQGNVGDYCPTCRKLRLFHVEVAYEVDHVYFVPLGNGTPKATTIECSVCETVLDAKVSHYDDCLSDKGRNKSQNLTVDSLVRKTNGRLALLRSIRDLVLGPSTPNNTEDPMDANDLAKSEPGLRRIFAALQEHYRGDVRVDALLARLVDWHGLERRAQLALQQDVEDYLADRRERSRTMAFIAEVAATAPEGAHFVIAFIVGIALSIAAIIVGADAGSDTVIFAGLGIALAASIGCFIVVGRWRFRRWLRNKLLRRADELQVDLVTLCSVLANVDQSDPSADQKVVALAKQLKYLVRILHEEGKLPDLDVSMEHGEHA